VAGPRIVERPNADPGVSDTTPGAGSRPRTTVRIEPVPGGQMSFEASVTPRRALITGTNGPGAYVVVVTARPDTVNDCSPEVGRRIHRRR
jgi:hypothetical protein